MNMNIAVYISLYINATANRIYHFNWEKKKKRPTKAKGPRVPESCNVDLIFGCDKQGCGATGI